MTAASIRHRTLLMGSCALATSLAAASYAPQARAQAYFDRALQGDIVTQTAGVTIARSPSQDTITINSAQAIITWNPETGYGALPPGTIDFLPAGRTANFVNGPGTNNYVVLNRILPSDTTRAISINGTVNSRVGIAGLPAATGGSVWFYSPGGIIVGDTARFNVGNLVLTSNDIIATGGLFGPGNTIRFDGSTTSTSNVTIQPNAQINLPNAGSYFAVVAPSIVQRGTVTVNGSVGYIAAQQANVSINAGLFGITFNTGSPGGVAIEHTGTTTGPAQTGIDRIVFATISKNTAISMLLQGTIGYAPAAVATMSNGQVVLTGGFNNGFATGPTPVDINFGNARFTSSVTARTTGALLAAPTASLLFDSSAFLSGNTSSILRATAGASIVVGGNLTLESRSADGSTGGIASLIADRAGGAAASVRVDGATLIDARGFGVDNGGLPGGLGTGGTASILVDGSFVSLGLATSSLTQVLALGNGGGSTGAAGAGRAGTASVTVRNAFTRGQGLVAQALSIDASAFGGEFGYGSVPGTVGGAATGGNALLAVENANADIADIQLFARATGGDATANGTGGDASGGTARFTLNGGTVNANTLVTNASEFSGVADSSGTTGNTTGSGLAAIDVTAGDLTVTQALSADASGFAIANAFFAGPTQTGTVRGGTARISATGGTITNTTGTTTLSSQASGIVYVGTAPPGPVFGGITTLTVSGGAVVSLAGLSANSSAIGSTGSGTLSPGGAATGGISTIVVDGARLVLTGVLSQLATGTGGSSRTLSGIGRGGTSTISVRNSTAANFGLFGGVVRLDASGIGGEAGYGAQPGAIGSAGFGGLAAIDLASGRLIISDTTITAQARGGAGNATGGNAGAGTARLSTLGTSTVTLNTLSADASEFYGIAGTGGRTGDTLGTGIAAVEIGGGTLDILQNVQINANASFNTLGGFGLGTSAITGVARGGTARFTGTSGATINNRTGTTFVFATANQRDNAGTLAPGGAFGGLATLSASSGATFNLAGMSVDASATGSRGIGTASIGGAATGGQSRLTINGGTVSAPLGTVNVLANALGGFGPARSGAGTGGLAAVSLDGFSGSGLTSTTLTIQATGQGGSGGGNFGPTAFGGTGTGGNAGITLNNSALTVAGSVTIGASGTGGQSGGTGTGGDAIGGTAAFTQTGGNATLRDVRISADESAGSPGTGGTSGTTSGLGTAAFDVFNAGSSTTITGTAGLVLSASAGFTLGRAFAGNPLVLRDLTGGTTRLTAGNGGVLNVLNGLATLSNTAIGGDVGTAQTVGFAQGGTVTVSANNDGTLGLFGLDANVSGTGSGTLVSTGSGGAARGGSILLDASSGGAITGGSGNLALSALGLGGSGGTPAAGTGGSISITVNDGALTGAGLLVDAAGSGGASTGNVTGAAGRGGIVDLTLSGNTGRLDFANDVTLSANGSGTTGEGQPIGQGSGGAATGGTMTVSLLGGTFDAGRFAVSANGVGITAAGGPSGPFRTSGSGRGGAATVTLDGATVTVDALTVTATGTGGAGTAGSASLTPTNGGDGLGGTASFIGTSGVLTGTLTVNAAGSGGAGGNAIGQAGGFGGIGTGGDAIVSTSGALLTLNLSSLGIDASAVGGRGGDGETGGAGGAAAGGRTSFTIAGTALSIGSTTLVAPATGGAAGASRSGAGAAGGNAVGGRASLTVSGLLGSLDFGGGGTLSLDVAATGAGGGRGATSGTGGSGGRGGDATGGTINILADAGRIDLRGLGNFDLFAQGSAGQGGNGGNATQFVPTGGGRGGDSGAGIGGTVDLRATGGTILGNALTGSVSGTSGNFSLGGFDAGRPGVPGNPLATPPVAPIPPIPPTQGANGNLTPGSGGTFTITSEAGAGGTAGIIDFGSASLSANGETDGFGGLGISGTIRLRNLGAGQVLNFGNLSGSAGQLFGIRSGSVVFDADDTVINVGNGSLTTAGDITINLTGLGAVIAGGVLEFRADGAINVTQSGAAANYAGLSADSISLFANNTVTTTGTLFTATNSIDITSAFGPAALGRMTATNRIFAGAGTDLTFESARTTGLVVDNNGEDPIGGRIDLVAGFNPYNPDAGLSPGILIVNGVVDATGLARLSAGTDIIVQAGGSIASNNRVELFSGDDIIVNTGASLIAARNPVPGSATLPFQTNGLLILNAGGAALNFSPAPSEVASLIINGRVAAGDGTVSLVGGAIQANSAPIETGSLYASITNPPPVGTPPNNDGGQLTVDCVAGNICLGPLLGRNVIDISSANRVQIVTSDVRANSIRIVVRDDLTIGTMGSPSVFSASDSLTLESTFRNVNLFDVAVIGGQFAITAGNSVLGNGTLSSPGDVGITVGDSVVAGSISAGGTIVRAFELGYGTPAPFTVPGDFRVGSVSIGRGALSIDAGRAIAIESADVAGADIVLRAGLGARLGRTDTATNVTIDAQTIEFDSIASRGAATFTASSGDIVGNSLSAFDTVTLVAPGNIIVGDVFGGSVSIEAQQIANLGSIGGGGARVTAGSISVDNATGSSLALISGSDATLRNATIDGDIEIDAGGPVSFGTIVSTGGEFDIEALGDVTGTSVTAGHEFTISTTGGNVDVGTAIAGTLDVPPSPENRRSIGITAFGNVRLGSGTAPIHIGLASATGSITAGPLDAGQVVGLFAARDVNLSTIRAGDLVFVGNASMLAVLGPDYDPSGLNSLTPVPIGGAITATGLIEGRAIAMGAARRITASSLRANGGPLGLSSGSDILVGTAFATTSATVTSVGQTRFGTLNAGSATIRASSGGVTLDNATIGGDLAISSGDFVTIGRARIGGDLTIDAISTVALADILTTGIDPNNGEGSDFTANVDISTSGNVDIGTVRAFDSVFIDSGSLTVSSTTLGAGDDIIITTAGPAALGTTNAGRLLDVQAGTTIGFTTLTSGTSTLLRAATGITGGSATAGTSLTLSTTGGNIAFADVLAATTLNASAQGTITGTSARATSGPLTLTGTGGIDVGILFSGSDLTAISTGGRVRTTTATAGRDLVLTAGTAGLNVGTGIAARDVRYTSGSTIDAATTTAGDDIFASATGAVTLGTATANGNFVETGYGTTPDGANVTVSGSTVGFTQITSSAATTVTGTGAITGGAATAGSALTLSTTGGGIAFTNLTAGTELRATATGTVSGASARATAGPLTLIGTTGIDVPTLFSGGLTTLSAVNGAIRVAADLRSAGLVNASGRSVFLRSGGVLSTGTLLATAGDVDVLATGNLTATDTLASGSVTLNSGANLVVARIGGAVPGAPATLTLIPQDVTLTANNTITLNGNVTARRALAIRSGTLTSINALATGATIDIRSNDIAIGATASVGQQGTTTDVSLTNAGLAPTTIGGSGAATGYVLSNAEFGRVFGGNITIVAPAAGQRDAQRGGPTAAITPNVAPDVILDTLTVNGGQTANLGSGTLRIQTPGKLRIVGAVTLGNLVDTNRFEIFANTALEVVPTGSITMTASGGALAGTLALSSADILATSSGALADVATATDLTAVSDRLAANNTPPASDNGYFAAGGIRATVTGSLLIQNTGTSTTTANRDFALRRGFTVGSGGFTIVQGSSAPIRIAVNGRQVGTQTSTGAPTLNGFVTGVDLIANIFFVPFGQQTGPTGSPTGGTPIRFDSPALSAAGITLAASIFDPLSTVNGCKITAAGACRTNFDSGNIARDVIQNVERFSVSGQVLPVAIVEFQDFTGFIDRPLIDEPITGSGNDDFYSIDDDTICRPDSTIPCPPR